MSGTNAASLTPESQVWHQCKKLEIIKVLVANYVWHQRFMSGTRVLCLAPIIYVWHQCWKSDKNIQGEMVLCKINRARLISFLAPVFYVWHQCRMYDTCVASLAPIQEALEIISVLVANYVWHQCFLPGTSAGSLTKIYRAKWFYARLTEHS